ncbi:MAG TPA: sugar transferase [Terriglobia bacterium]|nr:sugar transferase [Terriglobia bacterium]
MPSNSARSRNGLAAECTSQIVPRELKGQLVLKRGLDLLISGTALVVLMPLLTLLAALVKLSSEGPIFYHWKVVGKHGIPFVGYKFRSMYKDADRRKQELLAQNEMSGPVFKMTNDPRITPVGRVLRKYSLDELPQLWSVFKGDMSLVGPRPPLVTEWDRFTEEQKRKLEVKPGLTCLWQVSGRNQISDFDDWVRLDLQYIQEWSLALDFKILLKTIPAVVLGKGK